MVEHVRCHTRVGYGQHSRANRDRYLVQLHQVAITFDDDIETLRVFSVSQSEIREIREIL